MGGKRVLARRQHPHDKLKKAGGDIEVLVKKDSTKKRLEEAVNDGISESLFLHVHSVQHVAHHYTLYKHSVSSSMHMAPLVA